MREALAKWRADNPDKKVGLVPTMGYLHEGHLQLVRESKSRSDLTGMSIFVNPLQFNNPDDLARYPVDTERDLELCKSEGVDLVFIPERREMFPEKTTHLQLAMPEFTKTLCGPGRPGHFEGVMLIVSRLFHLFNPDLAFFGKKDYQQFRILSRMVQELDFPVEIIGCETIREEDGLAMSSRNARLNATNRDQAGLIYRAMNLGLKTYHDGEHHIPTLIEIMKDVIHTGGQNMVEYLQIVDPHNLSELEELDFDTDLLIATAVDCGGVRLIDNLEVIRSDS